VTTLTRRIIGAIVVALLVVGCAADRLHRDGLVAIDRGDYEAGVADLGQAVARDPGNLAFRLDFEARREQAVQKLVAQGDAARADNQFDTAAVMYKRILTIDPANDRALHGLAGLEFDKRHGMDLAAARKDFERKDFDAAEEKVRVLLNEDPGYKAAQDLAAAINAARGPTTVAPRLQARENRKVTLQLRDAPTKMVFEVLQRETGINFILDKDVKSDTKTTLFVQDVPVDQALDLVLGQNQLARQILSSNMVMIYPNNPNKQKEYEQQIVRTFYLTNAEPKDVESMLKTVLGAKNMFIDERASAVVLRDTPDAIRMAEKLVASLDVAESEVMLEVEVLEMSSSKLQDLGILYPTTATLAPTPVGTAAASVGSSTLALSDLAHQNSHTVTITPLSVTLNAMKTAGVVNTLASPRIRARNKEKAKVLIGSRLPVITSGVTSIGASSATTLTSNVQYLDVGLTLEVQPTVHLDGDVAIKVNLEVSSVLKQVTIPSSNTIAYEIGTRNANTLLRLKDGETQILAGLIQDSDTRNANTIPGLGDIPLLGRLFGTHHTDHEKDEIVLSITPRIIRMQQRPSNETTEFWYGNESRTRTGPYISVGGAQSGSGNAAPAQGGSRAETVFPSVAPAGSPIGPQPVSPSVPAGEVSAPLGGAATSPPQTNTKSMATPAPTGLATRTVPGTILPANDATSVASGEPAADSGGAAGGDAATRTAPTPSAVSLDGPSQAKVGEEFQVTLQLSSDQGITRLRSQLRFDSTAMQLISATVGDVIPAAAGGPVIDTKGGNAQLNVIASPEDPVQGSGSLMVLRFKALAPRPATNISAMVNVLGGTGAAIGSSSAAPLRLAIAP
jgi:general secretion pathway protein D